MLRMLVEKALGQLSEAEIKGKYLTFTLPDKLHKPPELTNTFLLSKFNSRKDLAKTVISNGEVTTDLLFLGPGTMKVNIGDKAETRNIGLTLSNRIFMTLEGRLLGEVYDLSGVKVDQDAGKITGGLNFTRGFLLDFQFYCSARVTFEVTPYLRRYLRSYYSDWPEYPQLEADLKNIETSLKNEVWDIWKDTFKPLWNLSKKYKATFRWSVINSTVKCNSVFR